MMKEYRMNYLHGEEDCGKNDELHLLQERLDVDYGLLIRFKASLWH